MSPRAAWRLEALGFERVHDYVGGKADWLANGLPREGAKAAVPFAGELADRDPPTCRLDTRVAEMRAALDGSRHGFCLVVNERASCSAACAAARSPTPTGRWRQRR